MTTTVPKDHPLRHAIEEFWLADKAFRTMIEIGLGDFVAYERAWREFLRRIERVWTKTQAAVNKMPGWSGIESEVSALRKNDPLLQYLVQARNVDEHSVSDVAKDWTPEIKAVPAGSGAINVTWEPWDRPLLPVKNRGVIFQPPRQHLGTNFESLLKKGRAEPVIVAEFAMRFYVNFINRVSHEVVGAQRNP